MTIEQFGSIGEVIGALATVATLAYLAIQIRRSNLLSTVESNRFIQNKTGAYLLAIVQDADVARVFREGLRDRGSLNADDTVRFDLLLGEIVGGITSWFTDREVLGDKDNSRESFGVENLLAFLQTPGGAAWWAQYQDRYPPSARSGVEEILRTAEPPAAQEVLQPTQPDHGGLTP